MSPTSYQTAPPRSNGRYSSRHLTEGQEDSQNGGMMRMIQKIIDTERLVHSIKTVIAILIGLVLGNLIGIHAAQWIIITIIVVMCTQIYVGSVVQKAYLRFLGTVVGCLFAIGTIMFVGDSVKATVIAVSVSAFIFSYVATKREDLSAAGTLGAVTTAIIMLGQTPTISFALERFLEIAVGILIATLVSQFVLPIHARTHLRRLQAQTLEQLRDYYAAVMAINLEETPSVDFQSLDEDIAKSLIKQRQLAKDSKREPLGLAFKYQHFILTLFCEREMLRAMAMMELALSSVNKLKFQSAALESFNEKVIETFDCLIKMVETNDGTLACGRELSVAEIKIELLKNKEALSEEEWVYLDGFLFAAEVLVGALQKLAGVFGLSSP
jgi:uncharacterized membrane protein YccC